MKGYIFFTPEGFEKVKEEKNVLSPNNKENVIK